MPHKKGLKPRKDGEFLAWAKTVYDTCSVNAPMWGLDPALLQQLRNHTELAETTYQINIDKAVQSKTTTSAKNAAFLVLKQFLSAYVNLLEGNLLVPDDAIHNMGLRPRHPSAHQPLPIPDEAPVLVAIVGQHHDVTVYVSTLQHGHPTEYLKNGKYAGFILKYLIEGETQWQTVISTQLHHTLIFTDAEEGKYIRLQAAWVNPRMQNGPWSEEVRELIN